MTSSTMKKVQITVEPFFLSSPRGRIFSVYHRPKSEQPLRGKMLCVPPFNEEMNRSRSLITCLAQKLAGEGFGVLLIDLHGTGDSSGEFHDARWPDWVADIRIGLAWLGEQPCSGPSALLGIRLGAILATQVYVECNIHNMVLILWQAVVEGKTHLTQFMRVRMSAQLDRIDAVRETTGDMRRTLARGETIEVAGYEIHPALAGAVDAAVLLHHSLPAGARVLWMEQSNQAHAELAQSSRRVLETWQSSGINLQAMTFSDPLFWQVHDRVVAPQLISKTSDWLLSQVTQP